MKHIKWNDIPYEKLNEKFLRKIAWDGKVMIALTEVTQAARCPCTRTTTSRSRGS